MRWSNSQCKGGSLPEAWLTSRWSSLLEPVAGLSCSRWRSRISMQSVALPLLCVTLPVGVHVMCLLFCLASLRTHIDSSLSGTLSLATFMKSSATLRAAWTLIHAREANTRLTNNLTDLWEPCVSVCVPWGPLCVRWVRGGQGFNKGRRLVLGCQSERLRDTQPDGVQMKATRLDLFLQTSSKLMRQPSPFFL